MYDIDDIADVLNLINNALEGTRFEAVGYDNTGNFMLVMIDKKGEDTE